MKQQPFGYPPQPDGGYSPPSPPAKGDVIIICVSVTAFYFLKIPAFGTFAITHNCSATDIIGKSSDKQTVTAAISEHPA